MKSISDLERLNTRIISGKVKPQELGQVRDTLRISLELYDFHKAHQLEGDFERATHLVQGMRKAWELLDQFLVEYPSDLGSLEIFKDGFDSEFDRMKQLSTNGRDQIKAYELRLRDETGISSLKIKNHKTFGLLIEITKANLSRVPSHFIRRQTMVNNERFITDELTSLADDLASATDQALEQEQEIYKGLLEHLVPFRDVFKETAQYLASIDLMQSFAFLALEQAYCRPEISQNNSVCLRASRHPVVEGLVGRHSFVPNDLVIEGPDRHLLITGPNMAGKSTVM